MSQLVPCVLLLAVEVLLGCVEVQCWIQLGVSQLVPCVLLLAVEVLLGCVVVQCSIQLGVSQLVPCVLLLVVEVLLGCVVAAVLDSASVSVGSLCIIAGSRGPAGVCCCSGTGFGFCLICRVPVLVSWKSWVTIKVLEWPARSIACFQTVSIPSPPTLIYTLVLHLMLGLL